jgi:hypothetical protein
MLDAKMTMMMTELILFNAFSIQIQFKSHENIGLKQKNIE